MFVISQGLSMSLSIMTGIFRKWHIASVALCIVAAVLMHATPSFAQRIIATTAGTDVGGQASYTGQLVSARIAKDKPLLADNLAPQLAGVVRARAISVDHRFPISQEFLMEAIRASD
jgi:hypothetical protein